MGLDSVELVLRFEDEFSISISDDEAAESRTVGDIYRLILTKIKVTPGCLTSKAFYLTRRGLVDALGLARHSIRPVTPLSPLLPETTRRKQWGRIVKSIGLTVPPLRFHHELKQSIYMSAFAISAVISIPAPILAVIFFSAPLGIVAFVLAFIVWIALGTALSSLLLRLNQPRATELPADTVGELAQILLSLNQTYFQPANHSAPLTDEQVWLKVVDIFVDQLQIDREGVVPNAKIVDDLEVS
jgi:acyl carrier protein